MCENCGHEHPDLKDVAPEFVLLNKASDWTLERVSDNAPWEPNGFAAERFFDAFVNKHVDQMIDSLLKEMPMRAAVTHFARSVMSLGFTMGMKVHDNEEISASPDVYEPLPDVTQEEADQWLEENERAKAAIEIFKELATSASQNETLAVADEKEGRETGVVENVPGFYL